MSHAERLHDAGIHGSGRRGARRAAALAACLAAAALAAACTRGEPATGYEVIARFPHDTSAYTQGLLYHDGVLYESTGRYGLSELRRVEVETGRVLQRVRLPSDRFGEGLALLDGRLFQLTWESGVGYVYDLETLALLDSFHYSGEGWGLTTDGKSLIMSDGSDTLRFLDPHTFETVRTVAVHDNGSPLEEINELEYVGGVIYANIYRSDWIVRIDPESGRVLGWTNMRGLLPERERTPNTDVLNGIAYDSAGDRLFVTGKLWPALFHVRLTSGATP
ncbi:MAG TPA: glutaminyl-peptide cyclotransferase [Longimicrobiales bacterium]